MMTIFFFKDKFSNGGNPCYPSKRLISVGHGGRLGNNMGEYATLWYFSKILNNVEAFISPDLEKNLKKVFPHISLPVQNVPPSCIKEFLPMNGARDHEEIVNIFEESDFESLAFVFLDNAWSTNSIHLYHRYRKDILSEFRFSEHASANVKGFHDYLHSVHCKNSECCDQIHFVGIHVRRTDYEKWMLKWQNHAIVDESYYLSAMKLMIHRIGKLKKRDRLLFIVASDDPSWCKAIFSHFELKYPIIYTIEHYPVIQQKYLDSHNLSSCDNKLCEVAVNMEYVNFDLAVMASMNYSIYDYGTFGFWGAYLSQSEITISADLRGTNKPDLSKSFIKTQVVDTGAEGYTFLIRNYNHLQ